MIDCKSVVKIQNNFIMCVKVLSFLEVFSKLLSTLKSMDNNRANILEVLPFVDLYQLVLKEICTKLKIEN
jgi:hypothetical protein